MLHWLTYPYRKIGSTTSVVRDIVSGKHELYEKIKKSKKPLIILGESALNEKAGQYIFETFKARRLDIKVLRLSHIAFLEHSKL